MPGSNPPDHDSSYNIYADYDGTDKTYMGAAGVVHAELKVMRERRRRKADELVGLALSGGGIRSASFGLGVLQALAHRNWLPRIDYLSTVSGGGYIGSCLSYLLHRSWPNPNRDQPGEPDDICFGLDQANFPIGSYPMTGTSAERDALTDASARNPYHAARGEMLRFLRERASYLTPGEGVGLASLIAVVLRNSLLSVTFFLGFGAVLFMLLRDWGTFTPVGDWAPRFASWAAYLPVAVQSHLNLWWLASTALGLIFLLHTSLYALATFSFGKAPSMAGKGFAYRLRRGTEILLGRWLLWMLAFAVIGAIPAVVTYLDKALSRLPPIGDIDWAAFASAATAVTGIVATVAAFIQTGRPGKPRVPTGLLVTIAAAALGFAFLVGSYQLARAIDTRGGSAVQLGLIVLALGWFVNLNYFSLHRYYRDRLMETFLPDLTELLDRGRRHKRMRSVEGNSAMLRALWGGDDQTRNDDGPSAPPYHIINANVVLVSSRIPKYRGRGGDNFVFTPLYCGSNATGWARSASQLYSGLTLASAMGISGAAVNPNAGVGGEGVTRQPVLAMLMGIFNIRLGYWLPNPKWLTRYPHWRRADGEPRPAPPVGDWQSRLLTRLSAIGGDETPNFIYPGLSEVLLRQQLDEDSCQLQLSDGGHFENLGMYELVRRRLRLIIVCDGAADPGYQFADLANAVEKVRADFGALIIFPGAGLETLVPRSPAAMMQCESDGKPPLKYAERGYLVGRIRYADNTEGTLLYLTTTFPRGLSPDLYGYRRTHPEFPDEPTSDQFFDEKQFEAYRELGYQLTYNMINDPDVTLLDAVDAVGLGAGRIRPGTTAPRAARRPKRTPSRAAAPPG